MILRGGSGRESVLPNWSEKDGMPKDTEKRPLEKREMPRCGDRDYGGPVVIVSWVAGVVIVNWGTGAVIVSWVAGVVIVSWEAGAARR